MWYKALKPHVPGVSSDVLLFSENGLSLVHHYRVFGRSAAHASLRGKYMAKLRSFAIRAEAEARWESGHLPIRKNQSPLSKTRRAVSSVVLEVSLSTTSSPVVSSATSSAGAIAAALTSLRWAVNYLVVFVC